MTRRSGILALLICLLAWSGAALGGERGPGIEAHRALGTISLDGRLDEPDWANAKPVTQYWEYFPGDRNKPHDETDARILYDNQYLYIGIRMWLKERDELRSPIVRRDTITDSQDYLQLYIDPLGARRGSYLLRVNARGTRTDGFQNEAQQTEILDPDYDWDVRTSIDDKGWTAEYRIPLTTLRIAKSGPQHWSIIIFRGVPRQNNTQVTSTPIPHNSSCFLCLANDLYFPDLTPKTSDLLVTPSVVTGWDRERGTFGDKKGFKLQPSFDAKWLPYEGAAADITIKPDFSQVDADQDQLSSNARFAINFPEKRPFFREGTDLIALPIPMLYTRTISAPNWGLRFTQRNEDFSGTAFLARDDGKTAIVQPGFLFSEEGVPDFNSTVGFGRGIYTIGTLDMGATFATKNNADGSYNTVGGIDGTWSDATDRVFAQALVSHTRNPDRPDLLASWTGQQTAGNALLAEWDHTGETSVWTARYTRYDGGFRSWLGFIPRVGYDDWYAQYKYTQYFDNPNLTEIGPYVGYERLSGLSQPGEEGGAFAGFEVSALHALYATVSFYPDNGFVTEQGVQRHATYAAWTFSMNPVGLVVTKLNGSIGQMVDFDTGAVVNGSTADATLRVQPLDQLQIEARYAMTRLGNAVFDGSTLQESITGLTVTYFWNARFYMSLDEQRTRSHRFYPILDINKDRGQLATLQFTWEVDSETSAYWGMRYGSDTPLGVPPAKGNATELYIKLSKTFGT